MSLPELDPWLREARPTLQRSFSVSSVPPCENQDSHKAAESTEAEFQQQIPAPSDAMQDRASCSF